MALISGFTAASDLAEIWDGPFNFGENTTKNQINIKKVEELFKTFEDCMEPYGNHPGVEDDFEIFYKLAKKHFFTYLATKSSLK